MTFASLNNYANNIAYHFFHVIIIASMEFRIDRCVNIFLLIFLKIPLVCSSIISENELAFSLGIEIEMCWGTILPIDICNMALI